MPIGSSTFAPVWITNLTGASDTFTIRLLGDVYQNGTGGATVAVPRVRLTWDIAKKQSNGVSGIDIRLRYDPSLISSAMADPRLFHYMNGAGWQKQTGTTTTATGMLTYTSYTGSFSPFAIADGASTLPVRLSSFTARPLAKQVVLNWTSSLEENAESYIVQHSTDGLSWTAIGLVPATGTTTIARSYQLIHEHPVSGNNHYRLAQRDIDGAEYISKIVTVNFTPPTVTAVYPNPARNGKLQVALSVSAVVTISNSAGIIIFSKTLPAGVSTVRTTTFASGLYYVRAGSDKVSVMVDGR